MRLEDIYSFLEAVQIFWHNFRSDKVLIGIFVTIIALAMVSFAASKKGEEK